MICKICKIHNYPSFVTIDVMLTKRFELLRQRHLILSQACLPIPPREHMRDPQQAFKLVISQPNRTHRHEDFNPRSRGWLPQEASPSLFLSLFRATIYPGLIYTLSSISPNCGGGTRTLGSISIHLTEHLNTQIIIYMLRN